MQDEVAKLPAGAEYWLDKGSVPSVMANTMQMMSEQGADRMTILINQMKGSVMPKAYLTSGKEVEAKRAIPVSLMNSVQDVARLQGLEKELQQLVAKKDTMSAATYDKRYKETKDAIAVEKSKITADKLHKDLTVGLVAFIEMAETYDAMAEAEQEILSMKNKIANMEFEQPTGLLGQGTRIVKGMDSRTYKRFEYFLQNEFYNDATFNKNMLDHIVNRIMNVTSVSAIAFNVTGMVNNAFIASLNNSIESWGSDYFRRKSYQKMQGLYTTEFLPGYVSSLNKKKGPDKGFYGDKAMGSKYEALVKHFNMVNHQHDENNGKVSWLGKMWGYMGYEAGEYMVQSQIGNSILDSIMVKNTAGEEISLYDAYDFDPNTGELSLKPGYTLDNTEKHNITHRIWKTNERIHGNYRWKIQLEKYTVGRLALQFHKWVYPNYKQRFDKMHFDEALGGGMDVEGRYTTLFRFLKSINDLKSTTGAYGKLTQLQRNNLKKDLADAIYISVLVASYYIFRKIADGIPDEDPYLKKMVHWLSKEADRGTQELSVFVPGWGILESYRLIKNPFAASNSLQKFAVLMADVSKYPFQDDEHRHYVRGSFKGDLKVGKDVYDVVPILRMFNEWERLNQQSNFYIQ